MLCDHCVQRSVLFWGNPKNTGVVHYNTSEDKYTKVSKLPISNWFGFAACSFGTKIYLVGGIENGKWSGAFYSFDIMTKVWEKLPSLPFVRRRLSAVIYSKQISMEENQSRGKRKMLEHNLSCNGDVTNTSVKKKQKMSGKTDIGNNVTYAKVAVVVEYDGKMYHGFQAQDNTSKLTIQTSLEKALGMICKIKSRVNGAGRTDAGVHAIGMVVTALVPLHLVADSDLIKEFLNKMRSRTPNDISLRKICRVNLGFDPRKMVLLKRYTFCLSLGVAAAVGRQYLWDVSFWDIDIRLLKEAAKLFEGKHDFTLFCEQKKDIYIANSGLDNVLTINTIDVNVTKSRDKKIFIAFEGKSFRHKQVRKMVHAIVDIARGAKTKLEVQNQLTVGNKGPQMPPTNPTAPACGLTLSWIEYGDGYSDLCMKGCE